MPGEFTKRAFLNGRMDLTEAEAVIDVIEAESAAAAKNAAGQLAGAVTRRTEAVYDMLTDMAAHFAAALDYPDEDIEPFELENYARQLDEAIAGLDALMSTFERGRVLREGVRVSLIGRPNVGKSSLLNALLGYERAIVTDEPGTTRDTIEEKAVLGGVLLRLTDTAGLREAGGEVERLGVRRALQAAEDSDLVIAVFDGSEPLTERDEETLAVARRAKRAIAVVNKSDLHQELDSALLPGLLCPHCAHERQAAPRPGRAGRRRAGAVPRAGGSGGGDTHKRPPGGRGAPRAGLPARCARRHARRRPGGRRAHRDRAGSARPWRAERPHRRRRRDRPHILPLLRGEVILRNITLRKLIAARALTKKLTPVLSGRGCLFYSSSSLVSPMRIAVTLETSMGS